MPADEPLTDVKGRQVKVIHFSSGETLTDDSDEEEEEQLHQTPNASETGNKTWKDYSLFWGAHILKKSLGFCDFLGEKMAALLGLNTAKYQYAIDQYHRDHKNKPGEEILSHTSVHEERINLSKIANKQYGATNTPDKTKKQTLRETLQEDELNEGVSE